MQKQSRVVIQNIEPQIDEGQFLIKRVVCEPCVVQADIFSDGHQMLRADLVWKEEEKKSWKRHPMQLLLNDRWEATFSCSQAGNAFFTIEAWIDHYASWVSDTEKKIEGGCANKIDIKIGILLIDEISEKANARDKKTLLTLLEKVQKTSHIEEEFFFLSQKTILQLARKYPRQHTKYPTHFTVQFTRKKALFSSWYEIFPRSTGKKGKHGTLKSCVKELSRIAEMGFDVLYLPPIHPIGIAGRKGKNNSVKAALQEPGSPWAIGAKEGGHDAIHQELGTFKDFEELVKKAKSLNIEIALDLAFQCSADHPYVKEHPKWFLFRPDGSAQYAENPPKKYEDIIPFNFETDDFESLWQELKRIVLFWVGQGIKIFRVDNPHTKPFVFWQWLIKEVKSFDQDVLFLSEAFTRPKVMEYLAKVGFDQSYTYFTWRQDKQEIIEYLNSLVKSPLRDYFRPNFWPNTPDILPQHLQYGGQAAFMARLVMAATLSSNYGIYGPPFELCLSKALEGKEEYLDSEKYEIRSWDYNVQPNLSEFIALVNEIRKNNKAFQTTWNLEFLPCPNDKLLCYAKYPDCLVIVNLDFHYTQPGIVDMPLEKFGIQENDIYLVHDLLSGDKYMWKGRQNYIELNPRNCPAHIFKIYPHVKREQDFDYFISNEKQK